MGKEDEELIRRLGGVPVTLFLDISPSSMGLALIFLKGALSFGSPDLCERPSGGISYIHARTLECRSQCRDSVFCADTKFTQFTRRHPLILKRTRTQLLLLAENW
jgi:hypothetical protein